MLSNNDIFFEKENVVFILRIHVQCQKNIGELIEFCMAIIIGKRSIKAYLFKKESLISLQMELGNSEST